MKKIITIIIVLIILIVIVICGIYNKEITYYLGCKDYEKENYTSALEKLKIIEDSQKVDFINSNISGDGNFLLNLTNTIKEKEYDVEKIKIYSKLIKKGLNESNYEKIYNDTKEIDSNYSYDETKLIVCEYAEMLKKYYDTYEHNASKYNDIITDILYPIKDYEDAIILINECNKKIADIHISFAKDYSNKTLYADSIKEYNKAISIYKQIGNEKSSNTVQELEKEIENVENISRDFEWCEAYGCARKKEKGELHYCSIHKENPNATATMSTSTKNNNSGYSNYHKCEYPGCSNYASQTKYCSKHTTYKKCAKSGCNESVSYEGAKYCAKHTLEN